MKLDKDAVEIAMVERGFSVETLAAELDVCRQAVCKYGKGRSSRPTMVKRIADALGKEVCDIIVQGPERKLAQTRMILPLPYAG